MVAVPALTDGDRARIAEAVAAAETQTSVEICLILAHASSSYRECELIYPSLLALIGGGAIAAIGPGFGAAWLFTIEAALFGLGALLLQWPALRHALVPAGIKRKTAWRHARLNYARVSLKTLRTHRVVLVFCSAAEHYAEILVDDAVLEAVPESVWAPIVDRFKAQFAAGVVADAFVEVARACAAAVAEKFPHQPGQANELPDALAEI